jgi:hypothetical protein
VTGWCAACWRHIELTRHGRFITHLTGCQNRGAKCTNHAKCPHKRPCRAIGNTP